MQQPQDAEAARGIGIAQVFRQSARQHAGRVAVESQDGVRLTYRDLDRLAAGVAAFLLRRGVGRGDRIAVMSDPCPEYVAVNLAGAKLGVTVVGINTRSSVGDAEYCVQDSGAKILFFDRRHREVAEAAAGTAERVELDLHGRGGRPPGLGAVLESTDPASIPELGRPSDIHTIIYTSGTTGQPKGAMISQAAAAVRALRLVSWFGLTGQDAFLGWLPLFHTSGEEPLNATFLSGGRYLTFRRADPERLVEAVDDRGGTWSWFLPGMFAEFLDAARARRSRLRGLRFGGGYGNLLPARLLDDLLERGVDFVDLFGQTESSLLVAANRIHGTGERDWKKYPAPMLDIRIVRADGSETEVDEPGECVVRGPSVMSGYLNRPEATAETFEGGWLHTGDLLVRTHDGALRFVDRKKYLIKTGGENVYPLEVEAALATHPDVAEACVIGVPDDRWGETVKAFVVPHPGRTPDRAALDTHCQSRLARYKRPRLIEFIDARDVPRSTTGKVIRSELGTRPVRDDQRVPSPPSP
ncbi:class I adenylate-forming enzyme family protein [Spirillospora sp. CA-255316]